MPYSDRTGRQLALLSVCLAFRADAAHLRAAEHGFLGTSLPAQDADASSSAVLHTNPLAGHPFPLPRTNMPDGFGSKVEFQTVSEKDEASGRQVFHERLVRCGIEKDGNGNEKFPCNPAFDLRPFVKGLDRVGSGFNILTGEKTTPLFEWSVPPWFKPSYDSGRYNYDYKIPEQIVLTSLPSGEAGMVTELYNSYDEYQSRSQWSIGLGISTVGLSETFSLSSSSHRFRSAFRKYDVAISTQQYKLFELAVKPEIFGDCPYSAAVFTAETEVVNTAAAAFREDNGGVGDWDEEKVAKWLDHIKLNEYAKAFRKNGIDGAFLLDMTNADLVDLGVTRALDQHRFNFELARARRKIPAQGPMHPGPGPSGGPSFLSLKEEEGVSSGSIKGGEDEDEGEHEEKDDDEGELEEQERHPGSEHWSPLRLKLETEVDEITSRKDFTNFLNRHGIGVVSSDEWGDDSVSQIQSKLRDILAENDAQSGGPGKGRSEMEEQAQKFAKTIKKQAVIMERQKSGLSDPPDATLSSQSSASASLAERPATPLKLGQHKEAGARTGEDLAEQAKRTPGGHPVFVRMHLLRQGFRDAVTSLPVLLNEQIHMVCTDYDDTTGKFDLTGDAEKRHTLSQGAHAAEIEYRRFLSEWGTHYIRSAVMGGEVEIKTMVSRDAVNKKDEKTLEANMERELDMSETSNDEESSTDTESVSTSHNNPAETGAVVKNEEGAAAQVADGASTSSGETTTRKTHKAVEAPVKMLGGVLGVLGSGGMGMAQPLVEEALKNIQLKLSAKYGSSRASRASISAENNKNEVRFLGGDAQLNADEVGGDAFKAWKNTIRDDPVPVKKTLVPITELVRIFAGPNEGEQCPDDAVVNEIHQRAKMLECTTEKMIAEARHLADLDYEIAEAEKIKADAHTKILQSIQSNPDGSAAVGTGSAESKAWLEQCRVVASLKIKRQQTSRRLYRWSFRSEDQDAFPLTGSMDGSVLCARELKKIKHLEKKQMYKDTGMEAVKVDRRTGDKSVDHCTMCKTVYNTAKCLATTSGECGMSKRHRLTDVMHRIRAITDGNCKLSPSYMSAAEQEKSLGAVPSEVEAKVFKGKDFTRKTMGSSQWGGWSAILFADPEVLCHEAELTMSCQKWLAQELRQKPCVHGNDVTNADRRRLRLMSALDFGVRGKDVHQTTAQEACECAQMCDPFDRNDPNVVASAKAWAKEAPQRYNFVSNLNQEKLVDSFMGTKYQESLRQCVVQKYRSEPLVATSTTYQFFDGQSIPEWKKPAAETSAKCVVGPPKEGDEAVKDATFAPQIMGTFQARVSYPGHCKKEVFDCMENYYMNTGKSTRVSLQYVEPSETNDQTSEMIVYNRQDVAFIPGTKFAEPEDAVTLHRWRSQTPFATNPDWGAFGLVFAELVQTSEGLNNIVLVQSGLKTKPGEIKQGLIEWMKSSAGMGGRNPKDPRLIVELEDRDGADVCMWLYHICCAMGGVLKQIPLAQDHKHTGNACSQGTVCCPRLESGEKSVPWDADTLRLLRVLAHGHIQHAPRLADPKQFSGWEGHVPISPNGVGQCVDPFTIKQAFRGEDQGGEDSGKASEGVVVKDAPALPKDGVDKGDAEAAVSEPLTPPYGSRKGVTCVFVCEGQKSKSKRGDLRTKDQLTAVVLVQDHPRDKCIVKHTGTISSRVSRTESMSGNAKQWAKRMCSRVQADEGLFDAREQSGSGGAAYTVPDVSVRLDRVVPQGKMVELTASERVVLMCPTVDDRKLTKGSFEVAAGAFSATAPTECSDATMVGLMKEK
jgi:hypothetical protein